MSAISFFNLEYEDAPECFTLGFDFTTPAVIIGINRWLLAWFLERQRRLPLLKSYEAELLKVYPNTRFLVDSNVALGFGGVLSRFVQRDIFRKESFDFGLQKFTLPIPVVEEERGQCPCCGGSGEDTYHECLPCYGTGKEHRQDWQELTLAMATMSLLSATLFDLIPKLSKNEEGYLFKKQLLTIRIGFHNGHGTSFIGATLSPTMVSWLRGQQVKDMEGVSKAAYATYTRMFPSYRRFGFNSFTVRLSQETFSFDVPGDATGLFVDGTDRFKEGRGATLHCHNVDSPVQQLALLAGLAALCRQARQSLFG